MSYNLLDYPNSEPTTREPHFKTVMIAENPDIVAVSEIASAAGVSSFLANCLSGFGQTYASVPFINGPDSDRSIFYKPSKFNFVSQHVIATTLRNINVYELIHIQSGEILHIYVVHLKASTGFEAQRAAEVAAIRAETNALPVGSNFIICGDFNIYGSTEAAYTNLIQINANNNGHVIDPLAGIITSTGNWNNTANKGHHTQSTRTATLTDGGSTGGLDDRFDMILYSKGIQDAGGMTYIPNSLRAVGNDANHYNLEINATPTNTAVSAAVANALYFASDHLPVVANFGFSATALPVALISFMGNATDRQHTITWQTANEQNIDSYSLETAIDAENWKEITKITARHQPQYQATNTNIGADTQYYRLKIIENDGKFSYSGVIHIKAQYESQQLFAASPNPISDYAMIPYKLSQAQQIDIYLVDVYGKKVADLAHKYAEAGSNYIGLDAQKLQLSAGIYYCILSTKNGRSVSKIIKL